MTYEDRRDREWPRPQERPAEPRAWENRLLRYTILAIAFGIGWLIGDLIKAVWR